MYINIHTMLHGYPKAAVFLGGVQQFLFADFGPLTQ